MPEGDVLPAAVRHDILAGFIRKQRPLPHPARHGIDPLGTHAPVVDPAGIGIVRAGVDDRDFAGLPVGDIDEDLGAAPRIEDLLGLAEIQDALRAGHGGGSSGDRDLSPAPAGDFRQGRPELAGETPGTRRREFGRQDEPEQGDEQDRAEDEQGLAHVRECGRGCRLR